MHQDFIFAPFHDAIHAKKVVVPHADLLQIVCVKGPSDRGVVPLGDLVRGYGSAPRPRHHEHFLGPTRQITLFKRAMLLFQSHAVAHFQGGSLRFPLLGVQPLPHGFDVVSVDVARGHPDASVMGSIVPQHDLGQDGHKRQRVLDGEIPIEALLQGAIDTFHHAGFGVPGRGKVANASARHQASEGLVVKFFAVVRLKLEGGSTPGASQHLSKAWVMGALVLALRGSTHAYFENTSMTQSRYRLPLLYLAWLCTSTRSAAHFSSGPNTRTGSLGNRRRVGLCRVYPTSRCKRARALPAEMPRDLANHCTPPKLPGCDGSRYCRNRVASEIFFFFSSFSIRPFL